MTSSEYSSNRTSRDGSYTGQGAVLTVNGAEETLQVALIVDGDLAAFEQWRAPGRAMSLLAPATERMLAGCGLHARDLWGVACVRGPGGFTGLRLTLAFAVGLAAPGGALLGGMEYLPLLARGATLGLADDASEIWTLTHSRRGQAYVQGFTPSAGEVAAIDEPSPMPLSEAAALVASRAGRRVLLGSGLRRDHEAFIAALGPAVDSGEARALDRMFDSPRPEMLARAALECDFSEMPPEPLYLRDSDAEDNLDAIARGRGVAPDAARERLARLLSSKP